MPTLKTFFILTVLAFFLSGCGKSMQLLLEVDKEDKSIKRDICVGAKRFDLLLKDIEAGRLKIGMDKKAVLTRYGEPVLEFPEDNQAEKLLYRHPLKYFDSPKVYLFFDSNRKLARWETLRRQASDKKCGD